MDKQKIKERARRAFDWCTPRSLADLMQVVSGVLQYGGPVVVALTFAYGYLGDLGQFKPLAPLLFLMFLAFGLWLVELVKRILFSEPAPAIALTAASETLLTVEAKAGRRPKVQFYLTNDWQPGFSKTTLQPDEKGRTLQAEEIRVRVVATDKMQNVRLEITLGQMRGNHRDTLAQIGSDKFTGNVPKGVEQSFVIMRRAFWGETVSYVNSKTGAGGTSLVRCDDSVTFFPENPASFVASTGQNYYIKVDLFHDDGPDVANLKVFISDEDETLPRTKIRARDNLN